MFASALVWLAVACFAVPAPRGIIDLFELHEHPYPYTKYNNGHLLYRLFRPQHLEPGRKYPLIVWFHGYGPAEFKQIDFGQLRHIQHVFSSLEAASNFEFYLLAVQCPPDQPGFSAEPTMTPSVSSRVGAQTPGEATVEVIKALTKKYPISLDQITAVGLSGGGCACWELAARHPQLFAGVAPLASVGPDPQDMEKLVGIPIWAFNSNQDMSTIEAARLRIAALKQAGGIVHLTEIASTNHDCWGTAFDDYGLLNWLLSQKRNDPSSPPPGGGSSYSWAIAIFVAIVTATLAGGIWYAARKTRTPSVIG